MDEMMIKAILLIYTVCVLGAEMSRVSGLSSANMDNFINQCLRQGISTRFVLEYLAKRGVVYPVAEKRISDIAGTRENRASHTKRFEYIFNTIVDSMYSGVSNSDTIIKISGLGVQEGFTRSVIFGIELILSMVYQGMSDDAIKLEFAKQIPKEKEYIEIMIGGIRHRTRKNDGLDSLALLYKGSGVYCLIGSFCSIAQRVRVFIHADQYHRADWVTTSGYLLRSTGRLEAKSKGNTIIGNDVWLGMGCTIMSGVMIGDGAIIATNSHVVTNVGAYEVFGGNPARLIRRRFSDSQIAALLKTRWWDLPDELIHDLSVYLCSDDIDLAIHKTEEIRAQF
ncbi:MAG: CatB-related O-acetyltransferase [Magnetococcales bacterium]|nr:CatB-related O-acetyltransferase [Magnetococcales bacterium]